MAFSLGELVWKITGDTSGINRSLDQTEKQIGKTSTGLGKITSAIGGIQTLMAGAVASGLAVVFKKAIGEAAEAEENMVRLNQALASTHGVSGLVIGDLINISAELEKTSRFTDDQIQSAETMLLTFTKVHKETFPAAMKAIADMATVMKMDLTQAAVQVGKALNYPIQGVAALRRVGIQLSDTQEEQVKMFVELNDVASAQNIILGELSTQFGGQALAATKTSSGQIDQMKKSIDNLLQTIGEIFLPGLLDIFKAVEGICGVFKEFSDNLGLTSETAGETGQTTSVLASIVGGTLKVAFLSAIMPLWGLIAAVQLFNWVISDTKPAQISAEQYESFAKNSQIAAEQNSQAYRDLMEAKRQAEKKLGERPKSTGVDPYAKIKSDVNNLAAYFKKATTAQKTFIEAMRSIPKDQLDQTLDSLDSFPPAIKDAAKGFNELSENEAKALQNAVEQYKSGKINLVQFNTLWGSLTSKTREYYDTLNALQPGQLDKINAAIGDSINKSKSFSDQWNNMDFKERTQYISDQFNQMGAAIGNVFSSIAEYVDAMYQSQIDALDNAMKSELEAAGIHEETEAEKAEADLARAKESGDQEAILEAEKAVKKAKIEEKYQKKKMQLEYEMGMARWKFQLASATAAVPLAILNALASGWAAGPVMGPILGPLYAGLAGLAGAIQLAAVAKSKPEAPKFENGGIVGGQSYSGDNVTARVNSGELILNKAQQNNLAGQMSNIVARVVNTNEETLWNEIFNATRDGRLLIADRSLVAR